MRVLTRPLLLVRRPGRAFLRQWPLALAGEVEGIHQARVATRRLREALPLVVCGARDQEPGRVRRALRHLTRALGPSRELDVSRLLLASFGPRLPQHAGAIASTDRLLAGQRTDASMTLLQIGGAIDGEALVVRARELAGRLDDPRGRVRCARQAAARLGLRARTLDRAIVTAGRVYAPGPLHAVRVSLKKFRYTFELAVQLSRGQYDGSLRRLKTLQDVLGDMHDLQVLAARVRDAGAAAASRERPGFAAFAEFLDDEIRGLHGRYLGERLVLVPVLARATRLGQALAAAGASGAPPPARGVRTGGGVREEVQR